MHQSLGLAANVALVYKQIEAATATFKDSCPEGCQMRTLMRALLRSEGDKPCPSWPMAQAQGLWSARAAAKTFKNSPWCELVARSGTSRASSA